MKKKAAIFSGVIILLIIVCLALSVYTVEENEYACTIRFSKIINTTDSAGLHFKLPFLDSVKVFPLEN
jgi:regulator of protease activity HflC (stomatin/prohibitin superfamily)